MFDMAIEMEGIRTPVHIERVCRDDVPELATEPLCFVVIRVEDDDAHTTTHNLTKSPNTLIIEYRSGGKITIKANGLTAWHWEEKGGAMRIDDGQH